MPNIKSAKKRVLVNDKKTEQNKIIRSSLRTAIKKVDLLVKEGKLEEAKAFLNEAFAIIDSACSKNIIKKNNASNKKAKISKKVYNATKDAAVEEPKKEEVAVEEPAKEEVVAEEPVKKVRKPRAKKVEE